MEGVVNMRVVIYGTQENLYIISIGVFGWVKPLCTNTYFEKASVKQQYLGFYLAILSNAID